MTGCQGGEDPAPHINVRLKGHRFAPQPWAWGPDETILYALGVGATPPRDLGLVYEGGSGPTVLPTFASVPTSRGFLPMVEELGISLRDILHGDYRLTLHQPLAATGTAKVERHVEDVWDKGRDAVVVIVEQVWGESLLCSARSSWFVKGAGGFGGERGPSSSGVLPDPSRAPDVIRQRQIGPAQSALFRLSGDRNPIHIDPAFARAAGFDGVFIHGLCTFGMVGLEVLMTMCDGDPGQLGQFETRFVAPVRPGDVMDIMLWREGPELVCAQALIDGRPVLAGARATTR
jgi:acyl dehydratase